MIPFLACLVAVVILCSILAWASNEADKRRSAERARLIAIIVAQDVSPQAAVHAAKPASKAPRAEPEPRVIPIGL